MADNELSHKAATGLTFYAVILDGTTQAWNGSAFETLANANWTTYDVAMTEEDTTGVYSAVFPAGITTIAGYSILVFQQAGGSPASTDTYSAGSNAFWDGTTLSSSATPAQIWANASRTLTQSAVTPGANLDAGEIELLYASTFSQAITALGSLANRDALYVTVKTEKKQLDADALFQIDESNGLLILNGSTTVTAGNASITVDDESAGNITIVLNAAECGQLKPGDYYYDVKIVRSSGTPASTLAEGVLVVTDTVTDAVA